MGAKSDQVKGHAKEAAGILTGDKDLESKGKAIVVLVSSKRRSTG